jgi:hypothetical protein
MVQTLFDKLALPQKLLRFPWGLEVLTLKPTEVFYAVGANDVKDQRSTFASRAGCGSRFAFHAARTTLIICLRITGLYDVSVRHSFVRHFGDESTRPDVAPFGNALSRHGATNAGRRKSNEAVQRRKRVHRRSSGLAREKRHRARAEEGCWRGH